MNAKELETKRQNKSGLVSYCCPKCGQWLCDALHGATVRCEKCGVWAKEDRS